MAFSSWNPQDSSGNNSKGFHRPLSSSGFRGAIIQGWSSRTPLWDLVQPFSILCVFLLTSLSRVGLGLSAPSNRSWSPTPAQPRTHHFSKKRALPR